VSTRKPMRDGRPGGTLHALRARLSETEEALRAIRSGEVDALFVAGGEGDRVLVREGADSAYRVLVEAMSEGAAILDRDGALLYSNARLAAMLRAPLEAVMGASLLQYVAPGDQEALRALLDRGQAATCAGEITLVGQWRSKVVARLSLSPMVIHGRAAICAVLTDLSERKRSEEHVRSLSLRDDLTGLLNRRGFYTLAQQQLKLSRRLPGELILFFADLDGLKAVNDQHGHLEGDRALSDAAELLRRTFREADIVARLGGDEFAVLASGTPGLDAVALLDRLQAHLDVHNAGARRGYPLSMSVGWVRCEPGAEPEVAELLRLADAAMYEQKRRRRGLPVLLRR